MLVHEIRNLVAKDVSLELKQRYAFNGILLYVVSTIFVCYLSFTGVMGAETWNALFWIIMLFAAVNAVSKSFVQESIQRQLYYYTLASPQSIILSKVIYNSMLMIVLSALCILVFAALMGSFIHSWAVFSLALLLGSLGFASVLTMIAAIASRTNNNFALMAILSFPIMLPFLLLLMNVSSSALDKGTIADNATYLLALLLLDGVVVALSFILFPYLWRD